MQAKTKRIFGHGPLMIGLAAGLAFGCSRQPTLHELEARAAKGDSEGEFLLGRAYDRGERVPLDLARAIELYRRAAEQGNAKAMHNLASHYFAGSGVSQDIPEAIKWYRKAAEKGAPLSQEMLANLLIQGQYVPKNGAEAASWLEKAARQDYVPAQVRLAQVYYFGIADVPQDYVKAREWYVHASGHGDISSENALGVIYEHGLGCPVDIPAAIACYRKAANRGDGNAQGNLGRAYAEGIGVEKDPVEALQWLLLGSEQGKLNAQNYLNDFGDGGMKPEQIAEARKRAEAFRKAHPSVQTKK